MSSGRVFFLLNGVDQVLHTNVVFGTGPGRGNDSDFVNDAGLEKSLASVFGEDSVRPEDRDQYTYIQLISPLILSQLQLDARGNPIEFMTDGGSHSFFLRQVSIYNCLILSNSPDESTVLNDFYVYKACLKLFLCNSFGSIRYLREIKSSLPSSIGMDTFNIPKTTPESRNNSLANMERATGNEAHLADEIHSLKLFDIWNTDVITFMVKNCLLSKGSYLTQLHKNVLLNSGGDGGLDGSFSGDATFGTSTFLEVEKLLRNMMDQVHPSPDFLQANCFVDVAYRSETKRRRRSFVSSFSAKSSLTASSIEEEAVSSGDSDEVLTDDVAAPQDVVPDIRLLAAEFLAPAEKVCPRENWKLAAIVEYLRHQIESSLTDFRVKPVDHPPAFAYHSTLFLHCADGDVQKPYNVYFVFPTVPTSTRFSHVLSSPILSPASFVLLEEFPLSLAVFRAFRVLLKTLSLLLRGKKPSSTLIRGGYSDLNAIIIKQARFIIHCLTKALDKRYKNACRKHGTKPHTSSSRGNDEPSLPGWYQTDTDTPIASEDRVFRRRLSDADRQLGEVLRLGVIKDILKNPNALDSHSGASLKSLFNRLEQLFCHIYKPLLFRAIELGNSSKDATLSGLDPVFIRVRTDKFVKAMSLLSSPFAVNALELDFASTISVIAPSCRYALYVERNSNLHVELLSSQSFEDSSLANLKKFDFERVVWCALKQGYFEVSWTTKTDVCIYKLNFVPVEMTEEVFVTPNNEEEPNKLVNFFANSKAMEKFGWNEDFYGAVSSLYASVKGTPIARIDEQFCVFEKNGDDVSVLHDHFHTIQKVVTSKLV